MSKAPAFQERFDEINAMNQKFDQRSQYIGRPLKPEPVACAWDKTETILSTPENIKAYFVWLGEHLASTQDGVYVKMRVDEFGIESMQVDFPRVG